MPQGPASSGPSRRLLRIPQERNSSLVELKQIPRRWIALAAGLVFVVQTLTVAWTAGAMAAGPQLDAFGNPLCITSTDHHNPAPAGKHSKLGDCCTFGCSTGWTIVAESAGDSAVLRRPLLGSDVTFRVTSVARDEAPDHDPGSPRAPPLTV